MASLGYQLTVFPLNGSRFDIASVYREMPDTVEVMHDRSIDSLADFLVQREGYFDAVWVARTHNLDGIRPLLGSIPGPLNLPPSCSIPRRLEQCAKPAARHSPARPTADLEAAVRTATEACRYLRDHRNGE